MFNIVLRSGEKIFHDREKMTHVVLNMQTRVQDIIDTVSKHFVAHEMSRSLLVLKD